MVALRKHAASLGITEEELLRELEEEQKKQTPQLEPVVEENDEAASQESVVDDSLDYSLHSDVGDDDKVHGKSAEQILSKRNRRAMVNHRLRFTSKKKTKSTRRKKARSRALFGLI